MDLDKLKKKAKDLVDEQGDKISDGLEKVADVIDEKTDGKHTDKIQQGVAKAKEALDDLDGKRDDLKH